MSVLGSKSKQVRSIGDNSDFRLNIFGLWGVDSSFRIPQNSNFPFKDIKGTEDIHQGSLLGSSSKTVIVKITLT